MRGAVASWSGSLASVLDAGAASRRMLSGAAFGFENPVTGGVLGDCVGRLTVGDGVREGEDSVFLRICSTLSSRSAKPINNAPPVADSTNPTASATSSTIPPPTKPPEIAAKVVSAAAIANGTPTMMRMTHPAVRKRSFTSLTSLPYSSCPAAGQQRDIPVCDANGWLVNYSRGQGHSSSFVL